MDRWIRFAAMLLPVGGLFLFMSNEGYPTLAGKSGTYSILMERSE